MVAVEQVDVDRERERGRVVVEPTLGLNGVKALGEQDRRAGVSEGMEANGGNVCRSRNRGNRT